jgi:hypothetical protein
VRRCNREQTIRLRVVCNTEDCRLSTDTPELAASSCGGSKQVKTDLVDWPFLVP